MIETRNATIKSTMLGYEDHGIFTAILNLDYGGAGQGFGLCFLDAYNDKTKEREGTAFGMQFIIEVMKVVGVESWESLKGKHCRVKADYEKVHAIGHFLKDEWFSPQDLYDKFKSKTEQ